MGPVGSFFPSMSDQTQKKNPSRQGRFLWSIRYTIIQDPPIYCIYINNTVHEQCPLKYLFKNSLFNLSILLILKLPCR